MPGCARALPWPTPLHEDADSPFLLHSTSAPQATSPDDSDASMDFCCAVGTGRPESRSPGLPTSPVKVPSTRTDSPGCDSASGASCCSVAGMESALGSLDAPPAAQSPSLGDPSPPFTGPGATRAGATRGTDASDEGQDADASCGPLGRELAGTADIDWRRFVADWGRAGPGAALRAAGIPVIPRPRGGGAAGPVAGAERRSAACVALAHLLRNTPTDVAYVYDLGATSSVLAGWRASLPRVDPHYAVKCNPTEGLLATLAVQGAGFDCATAAEIERVLALGVSPTRVVYAHPCKPPAQLRRAHELGVSLTVVDDLPELVKLAREAPGMRALVRVRADDPGARCNLGTKFGCDADRDGPEIAEAAARLGVRLAGVSFHVGSGSGGAGAYRRAVETASRAWGHLIRAGHEPDVLDVGGGFLGAKVGGDTDFAGADGGSSERGLTRPEPEFAAPVAPTPAMRELGEAVDAIFPPSLYPGLRVVAEPGRLFAEPSAAFAARVVGARRGCLEGGERGGFDYYLADGVYGSMNCLLYDHATLPDPIVLRDDELEPAPGGGAARGTSTLFGPTCDGLDVLAHDVPLPALRTGDWLLFERWGAYTVAGAVDFNGFAVAKPPTAFCWGGW